MNPGLRAGSTFTSPPGSLGRAMVNAPCILGDQLLREVLPMIEMTCSPSHDLCLAQPYYLSLERVLGSYLCTRLIHPLLFRQIILCSWFLPPCPALQLLAIASGLTFMLQSPTIDLGMNLGSTLGCRLWLSPLRLYCLQI